MLLVRCFFVTAIRFLSVLRYLYLFGPYRDTYRGKKVSFLDINTRRRKCFYGLFAVITDVFEVCGLTEQR